MNAYCSPPAARGIGLATLLLLCAASPTLAGADLNEVGAILVYPIVVSIPGQETFLTVTNAGPEGVTAHISYINGEVGPDYCDECDFDIPLTGNDTETLVIGTGPTGIAIETEDAPISLSCPFPFGMIVITIEDQAGETKTDNVLIGEEIVVDYTSGASYSIPAIAIQGKAGGNGDRVLNFDDLEYTKLPRVVASGFLAPDFSGPDAITASLVAFTLGFERQYPPITDCSVTGYDADENPFSSSFQFGCWAVADLCAISPEFCYPNLGLYGQNNTHGWLQLNCRVDQDADGTFESDGGVHGAMLQTAPLGSVIRRNDATAPVLATASAWARLLHQSVTVGDAVSLTLSPAPGGLD